MMNEIARRVEEIIAAELGDFAAKAALDKDCEHLGITPEMLTSSHLPALADEVWRSVSFFADIERGDQVKEEIRHILA